MSHTIIDYTPQLTWDEQGGYWTAEIRELPGCSATGETQAEAIANLEKVFAVLKEAGTEKHPELPPPNFPG